MTEEEEKERKSKEKIMEKKTNHKQKKKKERWQQQKNKNPKQEENVDEEGSHRSEKKDRNSEPKTETQPNNSKNNVSSDAEKNKKTRKRKEVFPYGNYRNYYGYRIGQDIDGDPRLKVLKRDWFEGKECLDIGCNNGIITIHIAKKFRCKSILGIDIDSDRVADAYWHLRKIAREESPESTSAKAPKLEGSAERKVAADGSSSKERNLFDVVSFRRENFVQSHCPPEKHYDTILCLSVTKWIHLNWGDDGLITLFSKIWKLLRPGGTLVLEPQPWHSYEKNRLVSETATMNYRAIMFRPECFREILLDKIGFRLVEDITTGLSDGKTGFNRPIFAFHK